MNVLSRNGLDRDPGGGAMEGLVASEKENHACCSSSSDLKCCDEHAQLAQAYKTLGHPARLAILLKLSKQSKSCCGDICSGLPLAQSTVSQHLKVLRESGFITLEAAGQQSRYRVNTEKLAEFLDQSHVFFDHLSKTIEVD
ncbi:metalloregulator ArsR/SmtB family transcription factor [uncultured Cohaesibacter sp.]|uniref:ArsR/SmtB family transcription factor n=1 Tax=uncultured Cohaesibacter sp. TaxID=1002546 RepID=UPI00292F3A18|nr:metalloregulator ArsR/SmtB family transcription factor [uncultured Cohaesibacter sp.]